MSDDYEGQIRRIMGDLYEFIGLQTDEIAKHLFVKIVQKNPVLTGRSRASWRIGVGSPDQSRESAAAFPRPSDGSAEAAFSKAKQQLRKLEDGRLATVYITNSLAYVRDLERGSSRKSPHGMVAVSVQEVINGL